MDEIRWKKATAGTPRAEAPKAEGTPATPGMPAADARPERIEKQVSEETSRDLYSPVCNVFYAGRYITWASGRGLGPGNGEFFWPCKMASADRRVPFVAQKTYSHGRRNHRCLGGFMYKRI